MGRQRLGATCALATALFGLVAFWFWDTDVRWQGGLGRFTVRKPGIPGVTLACWLVGLTSSPWLGMAKL